MLPKKDWCLDCGQRGPFLKVALSRIFFAFFSLWIQPTWEPLINWLQMVRLNDSFSRRYSRNKWLSADKRWTESNFSNFKFEYRHQINFLTVCFFLQISGSITKHFVNVYIPTFASAPAVTGSVFCEGSENFCSISWKRKFSVSLESGYPVSGAVRRRNVQAKLIYFNFKLLRRVRNI